MTQTWTDLLFAHWPVDPSQVRSLVPMAFDVDLFDGVAWIGVVPFRMSNVGPRGVPALPGVSAFPELNVRTYVRVGRKSGVYFFSLDAASRIAVRVARTLLNLPYYSAVMSVENSGDGVNYRCVRNDASMAAFAGQYEPVGPVFHATPESLEYFLTERYCLYHLDRRGSPYRLDIHHPPWPLQRATASLHRNTMTDASGISLPPRSPVLHFARRLDVVAWAPSRLT